MFDISTFKYFCNLDNITSEDLGHTDDQSTRNSGEECQETKSENEDYMDYQRTMEMLENRILELETRISPQLSEMIEEDAVNDLHMT